MRMNFEVETFTKNISFIKVRGIRRGCVMRTHQIGSKKEWFGKLTGNKSELEVAGNSLDDLRFVSISSKFDRREKRLCGN